MHRSLHLASYSFAISFSVKTGLTSPPTLAEESIGTLEAYLCLDFKLGMGSFVALDAEKALFDLEIVSSCLILFIFNFYALDTIEPPTAAELGL